MATLHDARVELERKIAELDEDPFWPPERQSLRDDLEHFIDVSTWCSTASESAQTVTGQEADAEVCECRCWLLARLEAALPVSPGAVVNSLC